MHKFDTHDDDEVTTRFADVQTYETLEANNIYLTAAGIFPRVCNYVPLQHCKICVAFLIYTAVILDGDDTYFAVMTLLTIRDDTYSDTDSRGRVTRTFFS